MDSDSLSAIAQLLKVTTGPSVRATTCATIAACCSKDEGAALRRQIGTSTTGETIIRSLLMLSADSRCARLALSALINLSEDEKASATIIRCAGVELCANGLLDDDYQILAPLYSGLLSNLTRLSSGVDALIGKGKDTLAANASVLTLLRLVARIDKIPHVLWMSNACSTAEGRSVLLLRNQESDADDENRQPLTWLLRLLTSSNDATRLAAASAMRNCAMDEGCHDLLVNGTNALGVCLSSLVGPSSNLPLDHIKEAPVEVRSLAANPSKAKPEPLVEIRLLIVESLLLICKSLTGRAALRESGACLVLLEWTKQEKDDQVRASVSSIMQRISATDNDQHNLR